MGFDSPKKGAFAWIWINPIRVHEEKCLMPKNIVYFLVADDVLSEMVPVDIFIDNIGTYTGWPKIKYPLCNVSKN